ncbi:hypothetical protein CDAR_450571 [Caerostris darwini]|uniref:Uncharacterized protein n=1 Tax=Caerostris darwini TaxID=1538125 RepID=A0AAV4WN23_9ARAC|nr:hypothetical protein CDAR_450571 [Caerostris darwini]
MKHFKQCINVLQKSQVNDGVCTNSNNGDCLQTKLHAIFGEVSLHGDQRPCWGDFYFIIKILGFRGNQQRSLYGVWSNVCMRKPFLWKWMVGLYLIGMTSCLSMSRFRLGNLYYGNCWRDHIDKYTTTAVSIFFSFELTIPFFLLTSHLSTTEFEIASSPTPFRKFRLSSW